MVGAMTLVGRTRRSRSTSSPGLRVDTLEAVSTFSVKQTDFGITPFRGGPGGAVKVADRVDIEFKAVGVRAKEVVAAPARGVSWRALSAAYFAAALDAGRPP